MDIEDVEEEGEDEEDADSPVLEEARELVLAREADDGPLPW
jgi:hypothetical protein